MTTQVKNEKRVWWRFESQVLTNNRLIAALSWCDCLIVRFEMLQTCSDTAPPHLMSKRCLRLFNRLTRSSEKACWHLKGALFNFCVVSVAGGWFMLTASTCKLSVSSISSLLLEWRETLGRGTRERPCKSVTKKSSSMKQFKQTVHM